MLRAVAASLLTWMAIAGAVAQDVVVENEISGVVRLTEGGRLLEVENAVVYFRPDTPVALAAPETPYVVSTRRKQFEPRVLPIEVGSTVQFPNQDPILHNVFSLSPGNDFDLGLAGPGDGSSHRFESAGLVRVFCNVHQSMVAHILVLDSPFHTMAGSEGRFTLSGMPDGPGTLYVWQERARRPWRQAITLPLDGEIEASLAISARRVPDHKNKFGKPYRKGRDRGRRY